MHTRIKAEIIALAQANPTEEVCGFIYHDVAGIPHVLPCRNVAVDRAEEFEIDPQDHILALSKGPILGIYHAIPNGEAFSPADLENADEQAVPFYLYNVATGGWFDYIPSTYQPELIARPWCLGFQDCFSIPRDYYRQKFRLFIGDYDRDESYGHEEKGIILARYEAEGFAQVDLADIRTHDILMFKTDRVLPQHFGVFKGDSRFIHHTKDALSSVEMLSDRWLSRVFCVFRAKNELIPV